jgi:hypothetical protein
MLLRGVLLLGMQAHPALHDPGVFEAALRSLVLTNALAGRAN